MSGQGQVSSGEFSSNKFRSSQVWSGQVKVRSDQVRTGDSSGKVRSCLFKVTSDHARTTHVTSGKFMSGHISFSIVRVRSSSVSSCQVRAGQVQVR